MREILFRGKSIIDGQWKFGNLIIDEDGDPNIIPTNEVEKDGHHLYFNTDSPLWVKPETVGQYTGLKDKNGRKIFEGDIVRGGLDCESREVLFAETYNYGWYTNCDRCGMESLQEYECVDPNHNPVIYFDGEVIGNIFDNPELMEAPNADRA